MDEGVVAQDKISTCTSIFYSLKGRLGSVMDFN